MISSSVSKGRLPVTESKVSVIIQTETTINNTIPETTHLSRSSPLYVRVRVFNSSDFPEDDVSFFLPESRANFEFICNFRSKEDCERDLLSGLIRVNSYSSLEFLFAALSADSFTLSNAKLFLLTMGFSNPWNTSPLSIAWLRTLSDKVESERRLRLKRDLISCNALFSFTERYTMCSAS
eukprot:06176_4